MIWTSGFIRTRSACMPGASKPTVSRPSNRAGVVVTVANASGRAAPVNTVPADAAPVNAAAESEELLPVRELVVIPEVPLSRKTRYRITISGVRNINGVEGGGGSVAFETAAAAPPDSSGAEPPDSASRAARDTSGVTAPPDSSRGGPAISLRDLLSGRLRQ